MAHTESELDLVGWVLAARAAARSAGDAVAERVRCPTCFKRVARVVYGPHCLLRPAGWDNAIGPRLGALLARHGVCPWCGQRTTTPARTLVGRYRPHADAVARLDLDRAEDFFFP